MNSTKIKQFVLSHNLDHYTSQINILKKVIEISCKQIQPADKYYKEIQKIQKLIKIIKKQAKENKMSDLQICQIYGSSFQFVQSKYRQILYFMRLQKTDFQAYLNIKRFKNNQNKCGITLNIDTEAHDDRMLKDLNLLQIIDIEYHKFSIKSIIYKSSQILKKFQYHHKSIIENSNGDSLVQKIAQNYHVVPYHNFTHAFSVFAMFYYFSSTQSIKKYVNDFELYFGLISCLMHDLRHKGVNSVFQIKNKSQVAVNFGNISILQKMHRSTAFNIMQNLGSNSPLNSLNGDQAKYARKIITNCILATDMSKHYEYTAKLKDFKLNQTKSQDRLFIMESLIHACDIGNSLFSYDNYITWANLVCVQFHQQTQKEVQMGIQLTSHMRFQSLSYFYKNQHTFLNTVVLPIWQSLDQKLDQKKIKQKTEQIKQNSKKIGEHLRRNSDFMPRNNLSRQLINLLNLLKL